MIWQELGPADGSIWLNSYGKEVDGNFWADFSGDAVLHPEVFQISLSPDSTHEPVVVCPLIRDAEGNWFAGTEEMSLARGNRRIWLEKERRQAVSAPSAARLG